MTSKTRTEQITKAREVDTRIAAAWGEYYEVAARITQIEKRIAEQVKLARQMPRLAAQIERGNANAQDRADALKPEAAELRAAAEKIDADEYEGWTRFFLVQHIHNTTACSSFRPTTRIGWLPNVSGLTEAEAVAEHGATLCTICFPSAPVELTTKPVDDTVCAGSGTYVNRELPNRLGYYSGNWGTCPECGERVTVPGQRGVKLRKHK